MTTLQGRLQCLQRQSCCIGVFCRCGLNQRDRESFGIIGQIGFFLEHLPLGALEISPRIAVEQARKEFKAYSGYTFISSSDAHFIEHIGQSTTQFLLTEPSLGEIKKALQKEDGTMIIILFGKSTG